MPTFPHLIDGYNNNNNNTNGNSTSLDVRNKCVSTYEDISEHYLCFSYRFYFGKTNAGKGERECLEWGGVEFF